MAKDPANPDDFGPMLTLAQAADILGVHTETARLYAKAGTIPSHRLPGSKSYYIYKDELLDFIRAQPANPAPGARPVRVTSRERRESDTDTDVER